MMKLKALALVPVAVLAVGLTPGAAFAHPVGTPGTPSCFGERMHHANADHKRQAKDRVAGLQALVDAGFEPAIALFGETVTVREMMDFVRANCSDDPIVPTP
jgi:hypothetical protein